ncbi:spore germination protein [Alteribacillus iranensis]|uniref:Spore germination protein KA n=1 Tax=Alteribacillus iranensis TaxID=930128 RepID=A0A1I2CYD3_9BACI|nr:spore germination protein [Alteribacillus iranensis]SFE73311.1 spore germination protein KA [Alteribacillus iranensis]
MRGYPNVYRVLQRLKRNRNDQQKPAKPSISFTISLDENKNILKQQLGDSPDVMFRTMSIPMVNRGTQAALLLSIDGIIDDEAIREHVIEPLLKKPEDSQGNRLKERITINEWKEEENVYQAVEQVLKGNTLLLTEGSNKALLINASKFEVRSIDEPQAEQAIRGARDGFVESTAVNISLLRQRISHPSLRFQTIVVGEISRTTITLAYMNDIVDTQLLNRVRERIKEVKVDSLKSSGELEQYIEDHPYTMFPTIGNTARPDKAAALLMEGRILVLINGTPICLFIPHLFIENMQNVEDYNSRPYYVSFIRLLRFLSFIISTTFPAIYIAALNFHKETIPSDMIVPIVQARELVPFPLAMEVILSIIMFEVVREAGIRLPQQVGSALSIVGALILGEVAVSAGLFGAPTVIVVSIAYIASFVINPIADVTALLRVFFFAASSLFGAYGLFVAMLGLLTHMVSLTSVGVPYMAPFAPVYFRDWEDALIRLPLRWIKHRPRSVPHRRDEKITALPKTGGKE